MTHQICDACECVSLCSKSGCIPVTPMPEKPALPLSTSVTSLQLELSAALEMAVRDRMLVKELAAALGPFTMFRLEDIASLGENERYTITMLGFHMQQAVAALSKVPQ